MLDDGKGEAVCEVTEGAKGFVYALDLSFTQKRDDRLVHGEDGVNTLMRGVDKDDFLAVDRENHQMFPAISLDNLHKGRPSTHLIDLSCAKTMQQKYNQKPTPS